MVYRPQSAKKNAVKQRQAVASGGSCYSQWRAHCLPDVCRESFADDTPPEILLQRIWQAQLLRRTRLRLADGRPIQVLHPGFWNHEAGPDFQKAVIRLGDAPALSGAIEVDSLASDWKAHGHDINPAFENVILHVIWAGPASTHLPTLRLQPHLSGSLTDLVRDMGENNGLPEEFSGQCRAPLADLDHAAQQSLLSEAAEVRIQSKARALVESARLCGWESALWQGLFRALGYKHNMWPMQHLAEQIPAMQALGPVDVVGWQARLLGVAGWLPEDLSSYSKAGRFYLRNLWDYWWRERAALDPCQLPPRCWHLGGLRPANHPIRRLVLLAHWLAAGNVASRLEMWLQTEYPKARLVASLTELLNVAVPEFWKHHWTLRSPRQDRPCRLLGEARVTDLAVNVILPWFYARAQSGRQTVLLRRIQARYFQWPAAQDNAVLKLARERLFGGAWRLKGAAQQQGVLQIVRDFCDHAPATCEDCSFPDLVQSWPRERGDTPDS